MFKKKKKFKEIEDNRLLAIIDKIQIDINHLTEVEDHALDISDYILLKKQIEQAKHRFLYKQARNRKVRAN